MSVCLSLSLSVCLLSCCACCSLVCSVCNLFAQQLFCLSRSRVLWLCYLRQMVDFFMKPESEAIARVDVIHTLIHTLTLVWYTHRQHWVERNNCAPAASISGTHTCPHPSSVPTLSAASSRLYPDGVWPETVDRMCMCTSQRWVCVCPDAVSRRPATKQRQRQSK